MIAIAKKTKDQVKEEYPAIDLREKNTLIDERFKKQPHEYEDMILLGLIKETEEEERKTRNESFAFRKRNFDDYPYENPML